MERLRSLCAAMWPYMLFAAIAIISIGWFEKGTIVYFHDEIIPLNPRGSLIDYWYIWRDNINLGSLSAGGLPKLLPFAIFALGSMLGLSTQALEMAFYVGTLFLSGVGVYLLARYLSSFVTPMYSVIAGSTAGVLYMLSPFMIQYLWRLNYIVTRSWFVALLPFLMLALIYLIENGVKAKKSKLAALVFLSACLLMSPSFSHPSFFIMTVVALLIVAIIAIVRNAASIRRAATTFLLAIIVLTSVNAYWVLPRYSTASAEFENAATVGILTNLTFNSANLEVSKNFLLSSMPPIFDKIPWYSWTDYYTNPVFLLASLVLIAVGFYSLVRRDKVALVIGAAYLISLFLAIGISEPFGFVKELLFIGVPPLQAFRDPGKWGFLAVLFVSLLIGLGVGHLLNSSPNKKYSNITLVLLVLCMFAISFPFFTKNIIPNGYRYPSAQITIPDEYSEVANLLKRKNDYRPIVQLPLHGTHNYAKWEAGGYKGVDILRNLSGQPLLDMNASYEVKNVLKGFQSALVEDEVSEAATDNVLTGLGARFIVINFDSDPKYVVGPDPAAIETRLLSHKNVVRVHRSESLGLYEYVKDKDNPVESVKPVNDLQLLEQPTLVPLNKNKEWTLTSRSGSVSFNKNRVVLDFKLVNEANSSFYVKNDEPLNIDPLENEFIDLDIAKSEYYRIAISAEDRDGYSAWLPEVTKELSRNPQNSDKKLNNVYSLIDFEKPIKYLRINIFIEAPYAGNIKINAISSVRGLASDYNLFSRNNLDAAVYSNDQTYRSYNSTALVKKYERISPTKKKFTINGRGKILLHNKQLYDEGWRMTFLGSSGAKYVLESPSYANAGTMLWKIDLDEICTAQSSLCTKNSGGWSVKAELSYEPQKIIAIGMTITALTILAGCTLILWPTAKLKFKRNIYRNKIKSH